MQVPDEAKDVEERLGLFVTGPATRAKEGDRDRGMEALKLLSGFVNQARLRH